MSLYKFLGSFKSSGLQSRGVGTIIPSNHLIAALPERASLRWTKQWCTNS